MVDQTNDLGNAISYPTNVGETDIRHLEQNHTTFLMVDNGREDLSSSIEAATEFRIKFEVCEISYELQDLKCFHI